MNHQLKELLAELEQFGTAMTVQQPSGRERCSISRATPASSWPYSCVRQLRAAQYWKSMLQRLFDPVARERRSTIGGSVTAVEYPDYKITLATKTFARSGLASFIASIQDDAGQVLDTHCGFRVPKFHISRFQASEYPGWWANFKTSASPWRSARRGQRCSLTRRKWHHSSLSSKPIRSYNQSRSRGQWRIHEQSKQGHANRLKN